MAVETVKCTGLTSASPDAVWAIVQDFTRPWHPDIDWMKAETGPKGETRRRFAAGGEDKSYLEQLTYFSHSDKVMLYAVLEGMDGLKTYNARLHVGVGSDGGSVLTWQAEIEAAADRLSAIATGTRQIFKTGLATLADLKKTPPTPGKSPGRQVKLQSRMLGKSPCLVISVAPAGLKRTDILCLFLHGIGGQRGNWDAQLAEIGALVPAVSVDLRGYGDSMLGHEPSSVDAYCQDILAVADAFKARKIILCGLSYGSWLATGFAMRHSDRLAGLVLAGGCTGMSEADPDAREAFRQSREIPLDAGQVPADFAPDVVRIIAGPNASEKVRAEMFASMAAISVETYRDALSCFTNPPEQFDFTRITCPVLLMTGEHDTLAPPDEIREVSQRMHEARQYSDIQFEVISGAGHICNLEQPDLFNTHMRRFVQKAGDGASKMVFSEKEIRRREKHSRILDAALIEFSRNGFSGASMQAIAERARVSKPTLYQYFGQKNTLLAAVLDEGKSELLAPLENIEDKRLVEVLWQFSWAYADFVLRPDMLSLARLIIGEAEHLPNVARDYQHKRPMKALAGIETYLREQKAVGLLDFDDTEMAAQHLWSLILSAPREHHLHDPAEKLDQGELARYITNGLIVFLRAYSTNVEADIALLAHLAASDNEMLTA